MSEAISPGWRRGKSMDLHASPPLSGESFEDIASIGGVRVERILSSDSPDTSPQVQAHDEWVLLIRGTARLALQADGRWEEVRLVAGDTLFIAGGTLHRVLETEKGALWLALHAPPPPVAGEASASRLSVDSDNESAPR